MIALTSIANDIETKLNNLLANTDNRSFKIFADLGDFQKTYKAYNSNEITRYINGVLEAQTPSILAIKGLQAMTQTFQVSFILDVEALNKDVNGNFAEVEQIRNILQTYIATYNGQPFAVVDGTITFELTPTFSGVIVGTESQISPLGRALPMYLNFSYTIIESGINTNNVEFILNGQNLFFESYQVSRVRTAETNMLATGNNSKTSVQANGISFTIKSPLLSSQISQAIENDVYAGKGNQAYCLQRKRGSTTYNYIAIIGNNSETGEIGKNIGQAIDFVEGKIDILTYGTGWTELTASGANYSQDYGATKPIVVFWGDGTSETIIQPTITDIHLYTMPTLTHTYTDGKATHTIRVFSYGNDFVLVR